MKIKINYEVESTRYNDTQMEKLRFTIDNTVVEFIKGALEDTKNPVGHSMEYNYFSINGNTKLDK